MGRNIYKKLILKNNCTIGIKSSQKFIMALYITAVFTILKQQHQIYIKQSIDVHCICKLSVQIGWNRMFNPYVSWEAFTSLKSNITIAVSGVLCSTVAQQYICTNKCSLSLPCIYSIFTDISKHTQINAPACHSHTFSELNIYIIRCIFPCILQPWWKEKNYQERHNPNKNISLSNWNM